MNSFSTIAALVISTSTLAQTEVKIMASDGTEDDSFGSAVSVQRDTVIIGAPYDDDGGKGRGSAYVFTRDLGGIDNWGELKKLFAEDIANEDRFGTSVSVFGDTVVIGAPAENSDRGSAYVFSRNHGGSNNWGQVTKLVAEDAPFNARFGTSVSLHADTVVIGASSDASNRGSAYVFSRDMGGAENWGQVTKLTTSDGVSDDRFGESVSLSGHIAVIGAFGDSDNGLASGSAYVFSRGKGGANNWGEVTKLKAADGAMFDRFGLSVAVNGDTAIIGASGDDDNLSSSGSAYVFSRNQGGKDAWGEVTKLTSSDADEGDQFGSSVSIDGDSIVIGARAENEARGAAYIFLRHEGGLDAWGEVSKLTASDGAEGDQFGGAVSTNGNTAVVGASIGFGASPWSGTAYVEIGAPIVGDLIFEGGFE